MCMIPCALLVLYAYAWPGPAETRGKTVRLRSCNYFSHLFTPVCSVSISQLVFMFNSERQMEKHQLICADGRRLRSTLQYSLLRSVFYGWTEHGKQDVLTTSAKLIQLEEDKFFVFVFVLFLSIFDFSLSLFSYLTPSSRLAWFSMNLPLLRLLIWIVSLTLFWQIPLFSLIFFVFFSFFFTWFCI